MSFVIKHDTDRYGETSGLRLFGARMVVSGVTAEQAESIADALSFYDAGLTDQYLVESPENTPRLAIAEYMQGTPDGVPPQAEPKTSHDTLTAQITAQRDLIAEEFQSHDPATCWWCLNYNGDCGSSATESKCADPDIAPEWPRINPTTGSLRFGLSAAHSKALMDAINPFAPRVNPNQRL